MNKKQRIISKIMVSLIILALSGLIEMSCSKREEENLKIGALIPLSGDSAFWGKNIQNGIELALAEINERGGILNKKVKIIYEDSQGNPTVSTQAVSKLISIDKVQCVIGDVISTVILAVAPIVEKEKVVLLGFGESALITNAGDYIFRNWNSAASDAEITGKYAARFSKKMIVLSRNDSFGQSAKKLFMEELIKNKIDIVFEENFLKDQTDFRTIITKFSSKEYDGIYLAGFHKEALVFLKQYKEMNLKVVNFYGVSSWEEESLIEFVKKNFPNKVFYGYPMPPDPNKPQVKSFYENYKLKYGKSPEILCDNGYDALYMLKFAIDKAGICNGEKIKNALYTLKDFEGASGTMTFDRNGDVHKPFGLKTITDKDILWLKD